MILKMRKIGRDQYVLIDIDNGDKVVFKGATPEEVYQAKTSIEVEAEGKAETPVKKKPAKSRRSIPTIE
jgi:hypothetical protein